MRPRGSLAFVCVTVAPWSLLGALLHGFVLALAVALPLVLFLQPGPLLVLATFGSVEVAMTAVVYRLIAPGGLAPARAKFMTVVTVSAGFFAAFCGALVWYWMAFVGTGGGRPWTVGVIGLLAAVAFALAAGASLEAVLAGVRGE